MIFVKKAKNRRIRYFHQITYFPGSKHQCIMTLTLKPKLWRRLQNIPLFRWIESITWCWATILWNKFLAVVFHIFASVRPFFFDPLSVNQPTSSTLLAVLLLLTLCAKASESIIRKPWKHEWKYVRAGSKQASLHVSRKRRYPSPIHTTYCL